MNTFFSVEVEAEGTLARQAVDAVFTETKRVERMLSRFSPDSEISLVNREAWKKPQRVGLETFELLETCLTLSRRTDGAFDVTTAPITDLWRSAEQKGTVPTADEILDVKRLVGNDHIVLDADNGAVSLTCCGAQLDLGAIGKGYALDRACAVLRAMGIRSAILNMGGHISSVSPEEEARIFALRDPLDPDTTLANVPVRNGSISTSANYERFMKIADLTFGHLMNPFTGQPHEGSISSSTVTAPSAAVADALSTAFIILEEERAKEILAEFDDTTCVFARHCGQRTESVLLNNDEKKRRNVMAM